jgi:long-chain fatty acid transport protein
MARSLLKAVAWAGLVWVGMASVAEAGGFSRGTAPTDLLYEDGNFNMRFDARAVIPHQTFKTSANPALVGTSFYDEYLIPSAGVKFNISENLRCAGTYTQNAGSDVTYEAPRVPTGKLDESFHTDEFGVTCAVRFDVGPGVLSVLGGGFVEELTYDRLTDLSVPVNLEAGATILPAGTNASLELDGQEYGWRAGVAYEIPEIRLRAELLYRSGTEYGAEGTLLVPADFAALNGLPTTSLPATATGALPQSVEFNLRSGIAEGWLAFTSVRWMDWSVLQTLSVTTALGTIVDEYHWRDGWTVTGGVVHSFSDVFAGQASLTWDSGVATGWDLRGETWTLALGGRVRAPVGGEFRFGTGFSYLASEETTEYDPGLNESTDEGYAITLNVGYIIQW